MTRTEETETRGYCSWSEGRSMLACQRCKERTRNSTARREVPSGSVSAPRGSSHNHVTQNIPFITPYSSLYIYSNSIFIPSANGQVSTPNTNGSLNRMYRRRATSDSPLTHHTHLAHWRILHNREKSRRNAKSPYLGVRVHPFTRVIFLGQNKRKE